MFDVALQPLWHDDIFWHLRTGEIVAHTGKVPRVDSFTHTVTGEPWTSHEWGFALLLYTVYWSFGYAGLVWLMAVMTWLVFAVLYRHMRRSLDALRAPGALPLLLLGLGAVAPSCLVLRAALLTSLGLATLGALLHRLHAHGNARVVAAILVLFLMWANCHAGVTFGLVMLAMHYAAAVLHAWGAKQVPFWRAPFTGTARARGLLTFGCAAITIVNANGFDLWTFPFRVNALFYRSGLKYDLGQYQSPSLADFPFFYLLVVVTLGACLPLQRLIARLKDSRRPVLAQTLCTAVFGCMALRSNRFILDFVVCALPFCAACLAADPDAAAQPQWQRRSIALAAGSVAAAVVALLVVQPRWRQPALAPSVPEPLARFMQHEHVAGRMFNYESVGGYLGWRLRQPVYWDGRNDIFGRIAHEFAYTEDFGVLVQRHALDVLVLNPTYQAKFADYLAAQRARWSLVYWDNECALYVERAPRFASLIEREEYRVLRPFGIPPDAEIARIATDESVRARVTSELERVLAHEPHVFAALYVRGELARLAHDSKTALAMFERAAAVYAEPHALFKLATVARELGRDDDARRYLERIQ